MNPVCDGLRIDRLHRLIQPEEVIRLNHLKSGVAMATAATDLFSMGATLSTSVQAADEAALHGMGANSCKGMGWVAKKAEADCKAAGGMVAK